MDRKKMMDQLVEWFKLDSRVYNVHNPIPLENFKWRLVRMTDAELKFEYELWDESNAAAGICGGRYSKPRRVRDGRI